MEIRLISPEEAAEIMSLKKNTVYEMIQRGNLRAIRMGKQFRILKKDLYAYLGISDIKKEYLTLCGHSPLIEQLCSIYNRIYGDKFNAVVLPSDSYGGIYYMHFHENTAAVCSLWDPETDAFNVPYARRLLPGEDVSLFRLGFHEIGLYVRKGNPFGIKSLEDFYGGNIRLCRPAKGRDARIYFDNYCILHNQYEENYLFSDSNALSDLESAYYVRTGKADAALCDCSTAARKCDLDFIPIKPASSDLFIRTGDLNKKKFQHLLTCVRSEEFRRCAEQIAGKTITDIGDHIL